MSTKQACQAPMLAQRSLGGSLFVNKSCFTGRLKRAPAYLSERQFDNCEIDNTRRRKRRKERKDEGGREVQCLGTARFGCNDLHRGYE